MITYKSGMTIPNSASCYKGFIIKSISKNGWCKIYHPSNVINGNVNDALTSVRIHWIAGTNSDYKFIND